MYLLLAQAPRVESNPTEIAPENLPSVGYGMEDRLTLGERIVNK